MDSPTRSTNCHVVAARSVCSGNDDNLVSAPTTPDEFGATVFPTHNRPLPTDWGLGHVKLKLVMDDGCLLGLGHDLNEPNPFLPAGVAGWVLVWTGRARSDQRKGPDPARWPQVWERKSGCRARNIQPESDHARRIAESLPVEMCGSLITWLEMTLLSSATDEPTELSLPNSDVAFQRRATWQRSTTSGCTQQSDSRDPSKWSWRTTVC